MSNEPTPKHVFTGVFIPAKIWLNPKFTPAEKMMLAEIKALSEDTGWCYAGNAHFAKWLNCSPQNISNYISGFKKNLFIDVKYKDEITHSGRMMRVNLAWYHSVETNQNDTITPYIPNVPPYTGAVPPYIPNVPPYTGAVTEIQFKNTSILNKEGECVREKNTPPPIKSFCLKEEVLEKEVPADAVVYLIETMNLEADPITVTTVEAITFTKNLPEPIKEEGLRLLSLDARPNAKTPTELQNSMRVFYQQRKTEWSDGVLKLSRGSKYPVAKQVEIVADWCCQVIKNNQGGNTYGMLNADLQKWFRNQDNADRWKAPKNGGFHNEAPAYTSPAPIIEATVHSR